ncbi:P-loop NTPase fold protein [Weissella cibaria]|uniref:YobI family P-loop NTPase n=1 Tax=Weissella cibaria TaxID=137591 RepID=UPI0014303616|nr:P-loop NTPase fold protein [Weissella cibaria]
MQQTKLKFRTTSAVSDADISGYEEFLNQILQDDETHNVAITGTYGSGKSSVLNSYEKKYKLEKEIHRIQIASFGAENLSDDQIELKLEKRIINNLRVAIPNSKLKGTGLYRPENITQKDIESLLSWGLAAVVPQIGIKYLQLSKVESFILGSISLLFIVMMVYTFLQIISKSQILAKVSFDKVSVDMNKSDEKTLDYFDDFMSDVIGAFAKLEVKYVVFEDLDRFENKYIFERLREINLLLNNVTPERIVFIYLIRNDLFTEIEMSKFFDATVPVVPVLDKSNSYSQFLKIAKNEYSLDVKELNVMKVGKIFEFIHDMRLLIAILNDYQLYSFLFSNDLLSKTKLLAMMVYKNVFPIDFSLAQNGQGV